MPPMVRSDATDAGDFDGSCSAIENPPDDVRRGAADGATPAVTFGPAMRMRLAGLVTATANPSRNTAKGGRVWLMAGKRPADFAGRAAACAGRPRRRNGDSK